MKSLLSSLYGRLSAIFLVLLLLLSVLQLWIGVQTARQFARESDQSLNRNLASDLARTFQPALREGLNREAIGGLIHDMMVYNPRVEIYLLDAKGRILAYFAPDEQIRRRKVSLAPVRRFLAGGDTLPILGDDPRDTERRKPFSVAPIEIGGVPGYLYLILGGEKYESIAGMVEESFIIRNSVITLVAAFLAIGLIGLLIFFFFTRRMRAMASSLRAFERGAPVPHLPERSADEIGQFAKAFNQMADRVVAQMDALRQADRLRRELVANVSHDLRSPLSSIQGYLETLQMKGERLPEAERQRFVEIIYTNARRLSTLVEELFELSRLEARQIEPDPEPFSMAELVQDVLLKCHPMALERRVRLRAEHPPDLPFVLADIGMIERVLTNLVDNALRHTPRDGEIVVRLRTLPDGVEVAVCDTGAGIAPEDLPHVFDRFYRADRSRSRLSGGSGIGLAIVRHIVQAHGRTIRVESVPNQGTTFTFSLPSALPEDASRQQSRS